MQQVKLYSPVGPSSTVLELVLLLDMLAVEEVAQNRRSRQQ
jgi:hypothetical protein